MPAHWLNIKPIKLGEKNSYLFITVLTSISAEAKFLGLSSISNPLVNLKPTFSFNGFNKAADNINTCLTLQLYSKGITLQAFNKRVSQFIKSNAATTTKHREFVKIKYTHNAEQGCEKHMKGISITISKDYKIVESCGTSEISIDRV